MKNVLFLIVGLVVGGGMVNYYYQYSGFHGDQGGIVGEPTQIDAGTANEFFKSYHSFFSAKLKTKTEDGIENIKTFVIRQSIIEHFDELIQTENANNLNPPVEQAGLALTLGRNRNGATLLVTALVCRQGADRNDIESTWHLLPDDDSDTRYIYDHLDLCPHTCPTNSVALSANEYYRGNPNRTPPYDSQINYWVRQP